MDFHKKERLIYYLGGAGAGIVGTSIGGAVWGLPPAKYVATAGVLLLAGGAVWLSQLDEPGEVVHDG